ncbi:MAG TPA: hypothetical protein VIQ51_16280, partial [Chryseosolibacter sp.]
MNARIIQSFEWQAGIRFPQMFGQAFLTWGRSFRNSGFPYSPFFVTFTLSPNAVDKTDFLNVIQHYAS